MITEAVILAGGLGTRLRSAVPDLPKCMAIVAGRPFISYVIDFYRQQGIEKFIFSVGYMHEVIEKYLRDEYPDLSYTCVVEEEPLGTGGAIRKACSVVESNNIAVLNGDTLFEINMHEFTDFHQRKRSECTLALKKMTDSDRYGTVEIASSGRISSFKEKNWYAESIINGGVYTLNVKAFLDRNLPEKFSFEKDYLEKLSSTAAIFGLLQDGYFIDMGIPSDYEKAQIDFAEKNRR
jgi:D-glycero-alpha-D-manno-heptose 1-phosphate guanylyltransferase